MDHESSRRTNKQKQIKKKKSLRKANSQKSLPPINEKAKGTLPELPSISDLRSFAQGTNVKPSHQLRRSKRRNQYANVTSSGYGTTKYNLPKIGASGSSDDALGKVKTKTRTNVRGRTEGLSSIERKHTTRRKKGAVGELSRVRKGR